jgi:hypothetical protein
MKPKQILRIVMICCPLGLAVAACGGGGGGGGSDKVTSPPLVITTPQEDKFGAAFGTAFRASPDSEPKVVNEGDIVPVSWTTEPIDINP